MANDLRVFAMPCHRGRVTFATGGHTPRACSVRTAGGEECTMKSAFTLGCLLVGLLTSSAAVRGAAPLLRVDLNPDNGRKDVLTRGWEDWRIGDGRLAPFKHRDITV